MCKRTVKMKTNLLYDIDIRKTLCEELHKQLPTKFKSMIINELMVGESIADVSVITEKNVSLFEIKSDMDSLVRLPKQVRDYDAVGDYCSLVTTDTFLQKIQDQFLIPDHWGILKASSIDGQVILESVRQPVYSPEVNPDYLAHSLWSDELIEHLTDINSLYGVKSKNNWYKSQRLIENTTTNELKRIYRNSHLKRGNWRDNNTIIIGEVKSEYERL